MTNILLVGIIVVFVLLFFVIIYNRLTRQRILVKEGWSGIGTFLQQRNDMIPNLVETVKGYAIHESKTLEKVISLRSRSMAAKTPSEQMEAGNEMNRALLDFFAVAEQYPDLKANANFLSLQNDLKEMETKINQSRRYYNGTVRDYNQSIAVFPNNLVAGIFHFTPEPFFEEESSAREVPNVTFS